jgi:hypothetical protein
MTRTAKEWQDIRNWSEQLSAQAEGGQLEPIEGSRTYRGENAPAMQDDDLLTIFHGRQGGIMTQEYTPTDQQVIDDYMPDDEDIGWDARTMSIGQWKRLKIAAFDRWLAAHDAEVRDKALALTDDELAIAEGAYESSIMEYEGDGLDAMSIALKAVAEERRSHEYRDR